jgi:phospholipid/cholesterol/gamma-HCH transport system ATP-binding protein
VNKSFDGAVVLEDLTIDFERGKTTVVLGPSGSGKSVLLRHIVGLLTPDRGEVHFEGHRVDTMKERELRRLRERVGFLFQLSALFDSMTVQENLEFPLRERTKMRRQERLDRVRENLRRVDLSGAERKMPSELSGGQQKRAALARALMLEPEVMLYDEPTTGLDPIRASEIDALINKMKAELGVTGIVVTHDLASAEHVGDRIVLLDGGHVLADGTMDELRRSEVPRVQAFLTGDGARLVPGSERDPGEPSKAAGGSSLADDRAAVERGAVHHSDAKADASNDTGETSTEHDA